MLTVGSAGVAGQVGGGARPIDLARYAPTSIREVTLITGDRVTVVLGQRGASIARVEPGKGRKVRFGVSQAHGRLRVIPQDALAGLRAGLLDPRLFDVSALLEFGYDDRRKDLPLIVTGQRAAVSGTGARSGTRAVPGGVAFRTAKQELGDFWRTMAGPSVRAVPGKVWLDGLRKPTLEQSVPQIGAPQAWQAGYTGEGVKVAVVDSGVDATHPDLAGRVVAARDFVGDGHDLDLVGHGTHVAATIGSNDAGFRGVAPGAQLLSAKVCLTFGCPESAILEGMQWSAEQGAKIVNISLGGADAPGIDPLEAAVEDLTQRYGILFVISAGNAGGDETIGSPGSAEAALTVGAVDSNDVLARFSSRGPRTGDSGIKPDITAPGVDIVAARSKDGALGEPGALRLSLSGTSMSAPHSAGAAAILAQQHPDWSPAQLKSALMGSASPRPDLGVYAQGAGRVDVARAIAQQVLASPPSVSFGVQAWPHDDDEPVSRTVTYANSGGSGVTLELSMPDAPAGLFTLSATSVTVPAGGTASVTLTATTRVAVPDARYGGYLVARAGNTTVTTPFAVDKEPERYDVSLTVLGRDGNPADFTNTLMIDTVRNQFVDVFGSESTVRVPRGEYLVLTLVFTESDISLLAEPEIDVHGDITLVADARNAEPVSVSMPMKDTARPLMVAAALVHFAEGTGAFFAFADSADISVYSGSGSPARTSPHLTGLVTAQYTAGGVDPFDSPFLAEVAWHQKGRAFHGLNKRLQWHDLATVEASYASQGLSDGFARFGPWWDDLPATDNPIDLGSSVRLPSQRLEYHNTDDNLRWARQLSEQNEFSEPVGNFLVGPPVRFLPGVRYTEARNVGVYGPGFTDPAPFPQLWLTRRGDSMTLFPTLTNDQLNWSGQPLAGEFRITLDRNGQRIADEPAPGLEIDVSPGSATYRLAASFARGEPNTLSTKVSCVWTFRSKHVAGDKPVPLPMSAVRFLPRLDSRNTAPAGRLTVVPIQVQRQPGSSAQRVRKLTVDVSFDDGVSWRSVAVVRLGQQAFVAIPHPAQPGFVSLRARSSDTDGNSVDQTVIRAYRIA
jgi:subtilisin family serine protease